MLTRVQPLRLLLGLSMIAANVQPVLAMGGGGPPISSMLKQYCTEQAVNKGITDVDKFQAEVRKCFNDPIHYPPTYK